MPKTLYAVKVRPSGAKRFLFLASGGRLNPLRIHALTWEEKAQAEKDAALIREGNEGMEVKVVTFWKENSPA